MPIIIKVGVSRKLTKDFNSTGYTLDIESEQPASIANEPEALANAADELYRLAEDIIQAQVDRYEQGPARTQLPPRHSPPYRQDAPRQGSGYGFRRDGNGGRQANAYRNPQGNGGNGNGGGNGGGEHRAMTDAQARAIEKMAKVVDSTADRIAQDEFNMPVRDLSVRQASQLIDQLKRSINGLRGEEVRR